MKKNLKKLIVLFTCLTILLSVSMVQVYAAPSISAKESFCLRWKDKTAESQWNFDERKMDNQQQ